jgi:hypothetical protein
MSAKAVERAGSATSGSYPGAGCAGVGGKYSSPSILDLLQDPTATLDGRALLPGGATRSLWPEAAKGEAEDRGGPRVGRSQARCPPRRQVTVRLGRAPADHTSIGPFGENLEALSISANSPTKNTV